MGSTSALRQGRAAQVQRTVLPAGTDHADPPPPPDPGCPAPPGKHGTPWMRRKYGCWCKATAVALRRAQKRSRAGLRLPPRGSDWNGVATARRLQGAAVRGYSSYALGPLLGVNPARVRHLQNRRFAMVTDPTAERVRVLVEHLHRQPPPAGAGVKRARSEAQRRGWAPLGAWLPDEIGDPDALSDLDYQRARTRPRSGAEYLEKHEVLGLAVEDIARDHGVTAEAVETGIRRERIREAALNRPQPDDPIVVNALCRVLAGEGIRPVAREMGLSHSRLVNIFAGRWRPVLLDQARSQFGRSDPVRYDNPAPPPTATTAPRKEGSAA